MKKYFKITSKFFLISFFLFVISKASGSEKLFYITTKSNWQSQTSSLTIQDSANIGSISLIPEENIIEIANRFFFQKGSLVLVHLELPTNDRSLKWKNEDSCGISIPYYLGQLSKKYIANVYSLEPGSENKYQLPLADVYKKVF